MNSCSLMPLKKLQRKLDLVSVKLYSGAFVVEGFNLINPVMLMVVKNLKKLRAQLI
jgi:hypothetical protein